MREHVRSLGVQHAGALAYFDLIEDSIGDGGFRVDTWYSGLSAGTELTLVKGTNPYPHARWDSDLGVFRTGEPSITFPVQTMGYMEVGSVTESRRSDVHPGQVVAMAYGHKTGHTAGPDAFFVPVPQGLDPVVGIYLAHMGPICANGLLHAAADLVGLNVSSLGDGVRGRNVLVTGGGVIGLLTALMAAQHGATEVAVSDVSSPRLHAVEALGLIPLDQTETEVWRWCKEQWRHGAGDAGADVVFQCRGQYSHLALALSSLRPQGTVIDLAFYQSGGEALRLGEEFHHNGLAIRCAQIARVPRGLASAWNRQRLADETAQFLQACHDAVRDHVVTDIVPFDDAAGFVAELAARERHTIQAVFDVRG